MDVEAGQRWAVLIVTMCKHNVKKTVKMPTDIFIPMGYEGVKDTESKRQPGML